jgi:hypothetical protein
VGFFPVFFPPEGCLGHAPVHTQPGPVNALQAVVFEQAGLPHLQEESLPDILLETVMGRGAGAELGGIQGFPLAAGSENEEDSVQADAIRGAGLAAAERMGVDVFREEPGDFLPQVVGDAPVIVSG